MLYINNESSASSHPDGGNINKGKQGGISKDFDQVSMMSLGSLV